MKITQQNEERCPSWCRFFVYFSMPAALKPVVDVQCAMKCEQCFMFQCSKHSVQCSRYNALDSVVGGQDVFVNNYSFQRIFIHIFFNGFFYFSFIVIII